MSKQTAHKGWIALHRKIQDSFLWKQDREFSQAEAWIDILMEVQHSEKPKKVLIGQTVLLCYCGQSLKSIRTWASRWNWSRSKVCRFFELLKREGMLRTKDEGPTGRLTVCNYRLYNKQRDTIGTQIGTQIGTPKGSDKKDLQDTAGHKSGHKSDTDNNVINNDIYSPTSTEVRLSKLLLSEIQKRKPNFREPNIQIWAKHIDRLIRLDERTPDRIEAIILWSQQDDFWRVNILSAEKLRKQFDQLELRMDSQARQPATKPLKRDAEGKTPRERMLAENEKEREYAR